MSRTSAVVRARLAALVVAAAFCCFDALGQEADAQPPAEGGGPVLRVATKDAPPFSFRDQDGQWNGISIEVWRRAAGELGLRFELVERAVPEMFEELQAGTIDAAVAALTMTAERETMADFSLPIVGSGLGVAVESGERLGWVGVARAFFSPAFLQVLLALFAVLLIAGCLVWLFERRANPDQFGGPPHYGLASGIWWAAVTMTTVGYGDKSPQTVGGRVVALVWMFASLLVIGGFVASIASTLTLGGMAPRIQTASDLDSVRIGVVAGTTSELYAEGRLLLARSYPTVEGALAGIEAGEVDAVVHDRPILRYTLARGGHPGLEALELTLTEDYYGFAFPPESELREGLNRVLLRMLASGELDRVERRYLSLGGAL